MSKTGPLSSPLNHPTSNVRPKQRRQKDQGDVLKVVERLLAAVKEFRAALMAATYRDRVGHYRFRNEEGAQATTDARDAIAPLVRDLESVCTEVYGSFDSQTLPFADSSRMPDVCNAHFKLDCICHWPRTNDGDSTRGYAVDDFEDDATLRVLDEETLKPLCSYAKILRKRKRGRPRESDDRTDECVFSEWKTWRDNGGERSYAKFAEAKGYSAKDVKRAIERHQKRLKNHSA